MGHRFSRSVTALPASAENAGERRRRQGGERDGATCKQSALWHHLLIASCHTAAPMPVVQQPRQRRPACTPAAVLASPGSGLCMSSASDCSAEVTEGAWRDRSARTSSGSSGSSSSAAERRGVWRGREMVTERQAQWEGPLVGMRVKHGMSAAGPPRFLALAAPAPGALGLINPLRSAPCSRVRANSTSRCWCSATARDSSAPSRPAGRGREAAKDSQ